MIASSPLSPIPFGSTERNELTSPSALTTACRLLIMIAQPAVVLHLISGTNLCVLLDSLLNIVHDGLVIRFHETDSCRLEHAITDYDTPLMIRQPATVLQVMSRTGRRTLLDSLLFVVRDNTSSNGASSIRDNCTTLIRSRLLIMQRL